jgi:hypothetical protein
MGIELERGIVYDAEIDNELSNLHSCDVLLPPESSSFGGTIIVIVYRSSGSADIDAIEISIRTHDNMGGHVQRNHGPRLQGPSKVSEQ